MNVILITADTLRTDHLGCYGYVNNTSPNIDELASKSIMFIQACSTINNTNPSHVSIFTAKYPKNHGVYTNWTPLSKKHTTLTEILKKNGYKNAAFVSAGHLNSNSIGLGKGFDFYQNTQKTKVPADQTIKNAVHWIKANSKKKLFVWIHLFDPHMPYNPHVPYDKIFDPDYDGWGKIFFDVYNRGVPLSLVYQNHKLTESQKTILSLASQGRASALIWNNKIGLSDRDVKYVASLYDGEIRFMDNNIGVLLKEIENMGLSNKTLIVFTADHGESLGEHGIYCAHKGIYENSIDVPLIIHIPGMPSQKISGTISNLDILPTILDILNLKTNPEIQKVFDGKSLVPLMEGKVHDIRDVFFVEHANNLAKAIKKSGYKYIMPVEKNFPFFPKGYRHQEEMYCLKRDPEERVNLVKKDHLESISNELKVNLYKWTGKINSAEEESISYKHLDNEQVEKLKSLGYIQ